jgi:membrane protein
MRIPGLRELGLRGLARKLYQHWTDHAVPDKAAQLSYYFLFSLFPFLFFLVTLTPYLPIKGATDQLIARISAIMPAAATAILKEHLDSLVNVQHPKLLTFGLLIALWSASRGIDALRTALNLAYDVKETRPFWKTQALAIAVTVLSAVLVLASVALFALGTTAGEWIADRLGVERYYAIVWSWLRWPITALLIMFVLAVLYYVLPDAKQEWRFITPGSVIGTLLWLLATWGFTQYAEHFGKYNATYGSIGGVIVLMTWLYITGLVFILGGEINAILEHSAVGEGKAAGAHAPGEAPAAPEDRPSASPPGAIKDQAAAQRSHVEVVQRKHGDGAERVLEHERRTGNPLAPSSPDEDARH